ncbi:MAG: DUF4831 family protein [Alistipes sp.]|nr:DUF4831 family protein [Alistipes sp.]
MKKILGLFSLLLLGVPAAAQSYDMTRLGVYSENGTLVIGRAETVLAVDLTVRCERIVCGPYARYAQKFLGLRAPLSDRSEHSIVGASVALLPDDARYATAAERLPAATCTVADHGAHGADFARLQVDRTDLAEGSDPQSAARAAASAIFSLRKQRMDLISGEEGENVFGAGLPAALERLERLEQEYLELFLGRRLVTVETRRFRVVPAEGGLQQIVCRFSPTDGLLPDDDLTGDIVLLQYEPLRPAYEVGPEGAKPSSATAPYRIASQVRCSLLFGGEALCTEVLPLFQFGKTVELSVPKNR